ncbi:MAG: hypothetical protein HC890_03530 [Chloroflexaceae bacterium]|nr:hypothetical protein [Chloroflexaceae bacterium]
MLIVLVVSFVILHNCISAVEFSSTREARDNLCLFPIWLQNRPAPSPWLRTASFSPLAAPISPRQHSLEQLAAIGEMAVSLVHELRNPLTTILLGLNACQRYELPEAAQLRLSIALDEAQRLQRLVDSILACARPYACPIDPSQPALYLQALLREIALIVALTPTFSQRRIEFNLPDDLICIRGDRDKLKQVFLNLLENACQAVAAGEKITWSVELADDRERVWTASIMTARSPQKSCPI